MYPKLIGLTSPLRLAFPAFELDVGERFIRWRGGDRNLGYLPPARVGESELAVREHLESVIVIVDHVMVVATQVAEIIELRLATFRPEL